MTHRWVQVSTGNVPPNIMAHQWTYVSEDADSTARGGWGTTWKCQNCKHQMRIPGESKTRPPAPDLKIMATLEDRSVLRMSCEELIAWGVQES